MQYTSNYNLMLPEGTDVVNLLTQLNPNISDIDAAMFAIKQQGVGRATELTAGTVHGITRANTDSPIFAFTATSNWAAGDSMTVDGVAVSVFLSDGTTPDTGAYVINTEVLALLSGSRVTLLVSTKTALASNVAYDNTNGLIATNVQNAIEELFTPVNIDSMFTPNTAYVTLNNIFFRAIVKHHMLNLSVTYSNLTSNAWNQIGTLDTYHRPDREIVTTIPSADGSGNTTYVKIDPTGEVSVYPHSNINGWTDFILINYLSR